MTGKKNDESKAKFDVIPPGDRHGEQGGRKTGKKNDADKARFDLIPPEAMKQLAEVLTFGCDKYSARNWEHGIAAGRLFAAIQRHLWAYWGGEPLDPESNLSHLAHALAGIVMLVTLHERGYYDA